MKSYTNLSLEKGLNSMSYKAYVRSLKGVKGYRFNGHDENGHRGATCWNDYVEPAMKDKYGKKREHEDIDALRARYVPTCSKCGRQTANWNKCIRCDKEVI